LTRRLRRVSAPPAGPAANQPAAAPTGDATEDHLIAQKLRGAWLHENGVQHLRGAARVVVCLAALLAADFLLDWGWLARNGLRFGPVLVVANLAVLSWALWSGWLRDLRAYDPLRVALAVEQRRPELSSLLVSCVQLANPQHNAPHVSLDLLSAMRRQAIEKSRAIEFRDLAALRSLRWPVGLATLTVAQCALFGFGFTEHRDAFFERLAGAEIVYPRTSTE
jgi:hypothetical protein